MLLSLSLGWKQETGVAGLGARHLDMLSDKYKRDPRSMSAMLVMTSARVRKSENFLFGIIIESTLALRIRYGF